MKMRPSFAWLVVWSWLCLACSPSNGASEPGSQSSKPKAAPLMVYAAASLRDVLAEIAQAFARVDGGAVDFNFAGSNVLAQQIAAAPGADLFIAADAHLLDELERGGHLVARSERVIVANSLVIVAHPAQERRLARIEDLPALPFRFLAVGDPNSVPAGRYARAYLSGIRADGAADVWTQVKTRIAPQPDVRAALALVEADPAVLGVVYRTDALASKRVKVLFEVPLDAEGAAVHYHAALVKSSTQPERARMLLTFLGEDTAQDIFAKHGFQRSE